MSVGILTWHRAVNHGAVLQAYASLRILEGLGVQPVLLDYERHAVDERSRGEMLRDKALKLLTGQVRNLPAQRAFQAEKKKVFAAFVQDRLHAGGLCTQTPCETIMIGSDMVFNLRQGYTGCMFGEGLQAERLFSYAASAGGSTPADAERFGVTDRIREGLRRFGSIGVRDAETAAFVKALSGRTDCTETIDPVLLYGYEREIAAAGDSRWAEHAPYMVLYSYHGHMENGAEVRAARAYAKKHGLRVVSCGYHHAWCDECVNAEPLEMPVIFAHAACVLTDTFHGTVFSLITGRRFASIVRGNAYKLTDLLNKCGMAAHIARGAGGIEAALDLPRSDGAYEAWLREQRAASLAFLRASVLR